ncbi:MAG TPA: HAMP domain-containing sensor histidine kinase [Polyangia bacterium]
MAALADVLQARRDEIVERFADRLYQLIASSALRREDVIDSLGDFLDEVIAGIRVDQQRGQLGVATTDSPTARAHGRQRFELGFDIGAMVREYGALRDVLFLVMEESGAVFTVAEVRSLSWYLVGGIANAASKYAQERDAELRRQTERHVGFLAHELRNPLASLRFAFDLLERLGLPPEGERAAAIVRTGINKLSELIDHALVGMKLQAGVQLQLEEVAVEPFVEALHAETSLDAQEKKISVALEIGATGLRADRKYLGSALSNLLRNAVKFTRQGGTIHVRVKGAGDRVVFEVEDECGGLPEGDVQKVFDPFVQLGKDRSGFGLGLAIAKQAVEAHEGSLRVHDLPGHGCVFVLDLPAAGPRIPQT